MATSDKGNGGDEWEPIVILIVLAVGAAAVYRALDKIDLFHWIFATSNQIANTIQVATLRWINLFHRHPSMAISNAIHGVYVHVAPTVAGLIVFIVLSKLILSIARKRAALRAGSAESVQRRVLMRLDKSNSRSGYGNRYLSALQVSRRTAPRIMYDRLMLRPAPVVLTALDYLRDVAMVEKDEKSGRFRITAKGRQFLKHPDDNEFLQNSDLEVLRYEVKHYHINTDNRNAHIKKQQNGIGNVQNEAPTSDGSPLLRLTGILVILTAGLVVVAITGPFGPQISSVLSHLR